VAFEDKVEDRFNASGVGTNAGVTVTQAAPSDLADVYYVAGIQCSGDAACIVTIESPASTVLWRKRFAAAFTMSESFGFTLRAAHGQAVLVKVSASTSNSEANIQGYRV
jgi:hypothetical protein